MSPVIKQGLIQLIYSTFLHNSEVIALTVAIAISLLLLLRKPERIYVLFLLGFTLLLARFEYLKHVVDPLYKQTVGVVITEQGEYLKTRRLMDLFFNDLVPLALYIFGWGSIFSAMFLSKKGGEKKK